MPLSLGDSKEENKPKSLSLGDPIGPTLKLGPPTLLPGVSNEDIPDTGKAVPLSQEEADYAYLTRKRGLRVHRCQKVCQDSRQLLN